MVQRIACPLLASFRSSVQIDQAVCESRPDVGSSKKRRSSGLVTNSTPMVRLHIETRHISVHNHIIRMDSSKLTASFARH